MLILAIQVLSVPKRPLSLFSAGPLPASPARCSKLARSLGAAAGGRRPPLRRAAWHMTRPALQLIRRICIAPQAAGAVRAIEAIATDPKATQLPLRHLRSLTNRAMNTTDARIALNSLPQLTAGLPWRCSLYLRHWRPQWLARSSSGGPKFLLCCINGLCETHSAINRSPFLSGAFGSQTHDLVQKSIHFCVFSMSETDALIQEALKAEEAERKLQKQQKHEAGEVV